MWHALAAGEAGAHVPVRVLRAPASTRSPVLLSGVHATHAGFQKVPGNSTRGGPGGGPGEWARAYLYDFIFKKI